MDKYNKKIILIVILLCTIALGIICGIYLPNSKINDTLDKIQTELVKDIVVSKETQKEVAETKNAVENGEKIETTKLTKSTPEEEKEVTDEGAEASLEPDALVEQENIAYNGTNAGQGTKLLGKWTGLTYYSQADSRWATKLYTSTNNKTQTMKSSACGPTSAAMVVSSAKGAILPTTMANLFVDNGFRTASSGTAWAAFPFVADYFGFKEYHSTSNFNTAMNYLKQKDKIGESKYYIIVSCGSGLFTTGGHYIVLAGLDDGTIRVFDPYLYNGKFNTASRKVANVKVKGTSAYVSEKNFKKYSNAQNYWIYSNDKGNAEKKEEKKETNKPYTRYVKVNGYLNVRKGAGTNYKVVGKLYNGDKVKVYEKKGEWRRIGTNKWVSSKYLIKKENKPKNTVGEKKTLKQECNLYSKKDLTGAKYTYKKNTTVKILKNIDSKVDYIQVLATGRKAYINIKYYK